MLLEESIGKFDIFYICLSRLWTDSLQFLCSNLPELSKCSTIGVITEVFQIPDTCTEKALESVVCVLIITRESEYPI